MESSLGGGEVLAAAVGASVGNVLGTEWGSVDGEILAAAVEASVGNVIGTKFQLFSSSFLHTKSYKIYILNMAN